MDTKQRATAAYEKSESSLHELSQWLYDNPELSYAEHESSARLAGMLTEQGFAVEYPAYGLDTAFAARIGKSGPEVVICAEYDALPGVGHACGHNIIAAAALGAGVALAPLVDELGIRVTILGTPAEEKFGGKVDLIDAGAFSGAAAAMMVHPSTRDVVDPNIIAIAELDVHFHGKTAHASAYPQLGRNALDAFVQAYVNIATLRQHLYPTDKIHGIIVSGGEAPNIIPDYTHSSWYVRSQTAERLAELLERVHACFEAGAAASGCTVEIEKVGHQYEEMASNEVMATTYLDNSRALGRDMVRGSELPPSETGSTDMGNVSRIVPTIHPMLDIHASPHVNHQAEFAAHTVTPDGMRAIRDGALGMAWTIIDLAQRDLWSQLG
ncbi:MAG: M20 family metallopeptidase [Acidimicrobiia bacterium]|nr:M20 family metallopeptidase [Acidimicrobiia bacterium]